MGKCARRHGLANRSAHRLESRTHPCTLSQATHHLPKFNASSVHLDSSADAGARLPRSLNYLSVYLKAHPGSIFEPHPLFLHATAAAELVKGPLTTRHRESFAFFAASPVPQFPLPVMIVRLSAGLGWLLPAAAACPCRWYLPRLCFCLFVHLA